MRTVPEYTSHYWRAFGRYLDYGTETDLLGIDVADILYMVNSLEASDLADFQKLNRNHDSNPLSEAEISRLLRELRAQIMTMVNKLRFHHKHDDALGPDDINAHFTSEAISLIRQYDHLTPVHMLATVRSSLWNMLYNMQRYYGSEKHRILAVDGNGGFSLGRVSLDATFDDGNPVVTLADETPSIEGDISVASFISAIEKGSERLGAFLRDVVHTKERDMKSDCIDCSAVLKEARKRHSVDDNDLDWIRNQALRREYALL